MGKCWDLSVFLWNWKIVGEEFLVVDVEFPMNMKLHSK